jgi:uncharacterized protein
MNERSYIKIQKGGGMPTTEKKYVAVKDDFFSKPLFPLENVTLMGSRCSECGEVFFGKVAACQQCQSEKIQSVPLGKTGTLYSYTIVRNRPPGDYKGPDNPFVPFPVGLVELPDGVRVMSVIDADIDKLQIGISMDLSIQELYQDEEGNSVITYKFKPQKSESKK